MFACSRPGAVAACLVAAHLLQRERPATRDEQEPHERADHRALVEAFHERLRADLRAFGSEVEDRAVQDVDAPSHPKVRERVEVRLAQQGGNNTLIGDADSQRPRVYTGWHGDAVPQHEADAKAQSLPRVSQKGCEPVEPHLCEHGIGLSVRGLISGDRLGICLSASPNLCNRTFCRALLQIFGLTWVR